MECDRCLELLSARLDGELEPGQEQALEGHLAQCPRCRALEEQLALLCGALEELEEIPAPPDFARGIMGRVRAEEREKKVAPLFRRPQVRALTGLAACALLCAGLYQTGLLGPGMESDAAETGAAPQSASAFTQERTAEDAGGSCAMDSLAVAESALSAADSDLAEPGSGLTQAEPDLADAAPADSFDLQAESESLQAPQVEPELIRSAADQVLEWLGGPEAYPGAVWDGEKQDYLLEQGQVAEESWSLWLLYTFPSPNGEYLTFTLRRDSVRGEVASASFLNEFAVPAAGGEPLSLYDKAGNKTVSPAYYQAIGEDNN